MVLDHFYRWAILLFASATILIWIFFATHRCFAGHEIRGRTVAQRRGPTKVKYIEAWLSKDSSSDLKVAALAYLGDYGRADDLPAIRAELDAGEHQTTYAAVDAILRIKQRNDREDAIRSLIDLQPDSVTPNLLSMIFANGSSLDFPTPHRMSWAPNADVRRTAVCLLRQRRAIDVSTASQLLVRFGRKRQI